MVTSETVLALKKQLTAANKASDAQTCVDVLMRLESEVEPTAELLRETQVGVAVTKVTREPCSADVANLAQNLVKKWKQAVGNESSASPKRPSASAEPALPLSPVSPPASDSGALKKADSSATNALTGSTAAATSAPGTVTSHRILVTRKTRKRDASAIPPDDASLPASKSRKISSASTVTEGGNDVAKEPAGEKEDKKRDEKKDKPPPRTHKDDHVDFSVAFGPAKGTGAKVNAARVASCTALYDALACDSAAPSGVLIGRTLGIERTVWETFPPEPDGEGHPTAAYKAKLRFLLTLKNAHYSDYRERIISGELDPETLVAMKPSDFVSDDQKALDEKARLASLQSARISSSDLAEDIRAEVMWRPGGR